MRSLLPTSKPCRLTRRRLHIGKIEKVAGLPGNSLISKSGRETELYEENWAPFNRRRLPNNHRLNSVGCGATECSDMFCAPMNNYDWGCQRHWR
jgi:hypothetical protein